MSSPTNAQKLVFNLPVETLTNICGHLPNSDLKNLRLACKFLSLLIPLRFDRVFLSVQPRDIEVFLAIANHGRWRSQVTEIIYDDGLLAPYGSPHMWFQGDTWALHLEPDGLSTDSSPIPEWFIDIYERNEKVLREQKILESSNPLLSLAESWAYYYSLLTKQQEGLNSNVVADAFKVGLERFSNLHRVTVTPSAHGWIFEPVYETPAIRAFPPGFNYPVPVGWLPSHGWEWDGPPEWKDTEKNSFGVRTVLQVLAEHGHSGGVTELRLEGGPLLTGINGNIFNKSCPAMTNLTTLIARPSFRRLHIDVLWYYTGDFIFKTGLLADALVGAADAKSLEYLSLINYDYIQKKNAWKDPHPPSIHRIVSPGSVSNLKYLRISGFLANMHDLLEVLVKLPKTLEGLELSRIIWVPGSYKDMLVLMRKELDWGTRDIRPKISFGFAEPTDIWGQSICLDDRSNSFLYEDGPNPFTRECEAWLDTLSVLQRLENSCKTDVHAKENNKCCLTICCNAPRTVVSKAFGAGLEKSPRNKGMTI